MSIDPKALEAARDLLKAYPNGCYLSGKINVGLIARALLAGEGPVLSSGEGNSVAAGAAPIASKHTPGPWLPAAKPSSVVGWPIVAQDGRLICNIGWQPKQNYVSAELYERFYRECEANARLLAAAPAMLAALTWAAKQIGILSQYIETPGALAKFDECCAVIKSATGDDT